MHDKKMSHFIVSISYGDINLSFYYTYSYSVLCCGLGWKLISNFQYAADRMVKTFVTSEAGDLFDWRLLSELLF